MNKIPVIYILSNGRSGSTLLDLMLGAHPHIWTLGEAQFFPRDVKEGKLCGCGDPLGKCAFWFPLLSAIPLDVPSYPIDYFRLPHGGGRVLRWSLLPDVLRGEVSQKRKQATIEYGKHNVEFFKTVWEAAQQSKGRSIHWLVDASKDPYRLFWLQQSGLFDLRVVHLTKDPRAFVYSMTKNKLPWATRTVIRMTGRWLVENAIMTRLCKANFADNQVIHLRYEDLAEDPERTCHHLGKWLGTGFPQNVQNGFRDYENHAISGNQMRWQNTNIYLDEKWKSALPGLYKWLVRTVTYPLARDYGY